MHEDLYKQNPLNPSLPQHCSQCGGTIILGDRKPNEYMQSDGKIQSWEYTAKCENITGFKLRRLLPDNSHDDLLIIETPDGKDNITGKPHRTILERW